MYQQRIDKSVNLILSPKFKYVFVQTFMGVENQMNARVPRNQKGVTKISTTRERLKGRGENISSTTSIWNMNRDEDSGGLIQEVEGRECLGYITTSL